jgi:eukaryotic-like serine/threonine-protein kinase
MVYTWYRPPPVTRPVRHVIYSNQACREGPAHKVLPCRHRNPGDAALAERQFAHEVDKPAKIDASIMSLGAAGEPSPAASLAGLELAGGWLVKELVPRPEAATGGQYSASYLVESITGSKGFLKALDYSRAFRSPDPALALNNMTAAYLHERTLLQRCLNRKLRRVIRAVDFGSVAVPGSAFPVDYIIFERAVGDLRDQMMAMDRINNGWRLRTLHQISVGLLELHNSGIAHQDLKPSNVLHVAPDDAKIGDLGRSACRDVQCPFDDDPVPGTRAYAPPELLYDFAAPDFSRRRFGCDAYLLGSMVLYLFLGSGSTLLLISQLNEQHRPKAWRDGFAAVLPYLRVAFGEVLSQIAPQLKLAHPQGDLLRIVAELCEPDPALRGHPLDRNRPEMQYSLDSPSRIVPYKAKSGARD